MVGFFAPAHLLFSYRWITVSFVWFIGLFTVRWQYSNLPETEPSNKQEFSWNKLKQNPSLSLFSQISSNPNSTSLQTQLTEANPPNPPLIREIETRTLTKPERQRVSFDDLVKQKILESLSRADVSVNIIVEREGGKWKITKAKSRIRTRKPKPTQTKPLEAFFGKPRRRVA
ncbi:hypothetical protein DRO19_00155 [Candidatus Bathyarchaeota archaeon]|nr:MAG: hypothetical protein DRO19_00155 [Candidatus Bathyarchaeota archaeon]